MCAFAKRHIDPTLTYSNANFTYLSWFSLFHSSYPFYWTHIRDTWKEGSIPLQLFKKLGYKIRVFSSADLNYFQMDRVIFGNDRQLVDSIYEYFPLNLEPCERDRIATQDLIGSDRESEGNLFLIFFDSTHSEYSSPDFMRPFQPAAPSLDYLGITRSEKDLELLKNRYRNAIHWVDYLLGTFFDHLKACSQYDDSVVLITGDHGEEFFEEGSLFHGTHLNEWQTRVPLFYKLSSASPSSHIALSTHLDIFPSLLHILTGRHDFAPFFDGQSIFSADRCPFAFTMQHNGVDIPYEFRLTNGNVQLLGRFLNPPHIYTVPAIELISLKTCSGEPVEERMTLDDWSAAFDLLLKKEEVPR
jgi:uncharacterized protein